MKKLNTRELQSVSGGFDVGGQTSDPEYIDQKVKDKSGEILIDLALTQPVNPTDVKNLIYLALTQPVDPKVFLKLWNATSAS
jgi:bacteriocin-like protein